MARAPYFSKKTFKFLRDLKKNNNRDWFKDNKGAYEEHLKEPMLRFITDFGPALRKISKHFDADPSPVGGSLFRIYRDTRFGKDKTPYKTHLAAHFRHNAGKNVHAPGFYIHIEPKQVFMGAGIWRPETSAAKDIRHAIVNDPRSWKKVTGGKAFSRDYTLTGESLKRPPRGFDPEHPYLDDLKRKDFIATSELKEMDACQADFLTQFSKRCKSSAPFVEFLCDGLGVAF